MINLTKKQIIWLTNKGGRTIDDVCSDENGLYVLMQNADGYENIKVYIPNDNNMELRHYDSKYKHYQYVEVTGT